MIFILIFAGQTECNALYLNGKIRKKVEELTARSEKILIVCHVNPDGDAVGSAIALADYLQSVKGKEVSILSPNYLQEFLLWMDGADGILIYKRNRRKAEKAIDGCDLMFFLDFNNPERLGDARRAILRRDVPKIIIDHHIDPVPFADVTISDTSFSSTAEIVHQVVTSLNDGQPYSSDSYNTGIYTGVVTDTGNFVHGSFNGDTLRLVAGLLDAGIDRERVHDRLYNNFSEKRMRLVGMVLSQRMVVLTEYRTAYMWLTREDLKRYSYAKGDTEGLVNMPLSISGLRMSALFIEKEGFVKVSFRSKGDLSVNDFAVSYFNGGGHRNAAGGEYSDTLESALGRFKDSLKLFMAGEDGQELP